MKVFTQGCELAEALRREAGSCGFVPTMGALHAGHISLVTTARAVTDKVVVSIFVNPTQFNDPKDLRSYPRTLESDLTLLETAGADFVYTPSVEDIYPTPDTRVFDFGMIDKVMEGAQRPGHFNGVAQVVSRLFEIVGPDKAFFGEKDFQQLAIIRDLVRQCGFTTEIVGCPILRDHDGLALSSRNMLLTAEARTAAPLIYDTLRRAGTKATELSVEELTDWITAAINSNPELQVEYVTLADASTLQPVQGWESEVSVRAFVAVQAGAVRLIDNVAIR